MPFYQMGETYGLLNIAEGVRSKESQNLVYDQETLSVFERVLALVAFENIPGNWRLAQMPISSNPCPPIRRANECELQYEYREKYKMLMKTVHRH